jgi:hypothetical protein
MQAHGGYRLSTAANAAGISVKALSRNIDRKIVVPDPRNSAPGKGNRHRIDRRFIDVVAIGHALTRLSVNPGTAMSLAQKFLEPQRGRELGKPFDTGRTLMLVTTDGTASIINLEADQDISPFLHEATIIVDLGKIIATVNSRISN